MEKKRIAWMDMAKALGILMVLINHAELDLGVVNWLGGMFYMPIFFVLAGMTFSVKEGESLGQFALRKARRLLVPYVAYNLFLFAFFFCKDSLLTGQVTGDSFFPLLGMLYSRNCLYPMGTENNVQFMTVLNAPTWFLTCLFLTLVLFAGIEKIREKNPRAAVGTIVGCVLAAMGIHYASPILLPWSLECALYAVAFLEVGARLKKHNAVEVFAGKKWVLPVLLAVLVGLSVVNGPVNMSVGDYGNSMLLYLVVGSVSSLLCMVLCYLVEQRSVKKGAESCSGTLASAGAAIGKDSLRILCLHLFVFMIVRTLSGFLPYIGTEGPFLEILMITASILLLVTGSLKNKAWALLWVLLFTWYLPIINKGIDVQDTGFYLANYRYVFTPSVQINELYYLFAEVLGGVVYHLFPGHQLLALNWTCVVVYTAVALLVYRKLKPYMPKLVLQLCILAGSIFAITWVHCINWNAWSALFVTLGAWLLLYAIWKESPRLIGLSGFILGLNAFVRMPNILFLSLVVVVFWHELMKQRSPKRIWPAVKACLPMVAGGALAGVIGIAVSIGHLGPDKFIEDLAVLTALGAEGDLHSVTTGIYQFLVGLKDGALVWVRYGLVLAGAGAVLALAKKFWRSKSDSRKEQCILAAAILAAGAFGLVKGWQEDILRIQTFVAVAGIVLPGVAAWYYRKKDLAFSCLCLTAMIIEGFLTIGTDTATIYYRIYMGLPLAVTVCILCKWFRNRREWMVIPAFAVAFVLAGGLRYADTYIYHDGAKEELTETVDNPIFTGVYTTAERSECLNRLQEQLEPYEDYELITIGNFTAAQAMTDMKPFFRSSWPDLDYLTMELFEETLEEKLARGIYPVVVIATEEVNGAYWMPEKVEILEELVSEEPYEKLYEDHLYSLYVPKTVE